MNKLKTDFNQCNIGIEEVGRGYIDNDNFYYNYSENSFNSLTTTNTHQNAINIFFLAPNITYGRASNIPGLALVLGGSYAGTGVLTHEFGHCLGLYHTHSGSGCYDNANCTENINGNNCSTCGDLVCDTPADPCLSGKVNSSCQYIGGEGYSPDVLNIMSYAPPTCLTHLSTGQIARMHLMILYSPIFQNVITSRTIISGSDVICSSSAYTYNLINTVPGITVSWETSSQLTITSSTNTSVTVTTKNGYWGQEVTITAIINNGARVTKKVWLGGPSGFLDIVGPETVCQNCSVSYKTEPTPNSTPENYITGYTWNAGNGGYVFPGASCTADMLFPRTGYTTILVARYNACGQEDWHRKEIYVSGGGMGFSAAYPNPAGNSLTIERAQQSSEMSIAKSTASNTLTVQLYNQSKQLVREQTFSGERLTLDVSTLPNGTYFLNIIENGRVVEVQTVIVSH